MAAQTLGFVWLAIGVVILVVLLATGRKADLSAIGEVEAGEQPHTAAQPSAQEPRREDLR